MPPAGEAYYRGYEQYHPLHNLAAPTITPPPSAPPSNAGTEPSPYSNSIYKFFGENVIRPSFGDDFLANGSDLAVYGTYWATGMAGGLLAYFGGAAIISTSTIYGAAGNGALWGGIEYLTIGGIMEIGSGGLVPDMTLEGLASSVAFGGIIGGGGKYLIDPIMGLAGNIVRKVDDAVEAVDEILDSTRRVSGQTGFKDSARLNRSELTKLKLKAKELGVTFVKNADDYMHKIGLGDNVRGAFDFETGAIYLRKGATAYEAFHEMAHAQQWASIGREAYIGLGKYARESHVFQEIWKNRSQFSKAELQHAIDYMRDIRELFQLGRID